MIIVLYKSTKKWTSICWFLQKLQNQLNRSLQCTNEKKFGDCLLIWSWFSSSDDGPSPSNLHDGAIDAHHLRFDIHIWRCFWHVDPITKNVLDGWVPPPKTAILPRLAFADHSFLVAACWKVSYKTLPHCVVHLYIQHNSMLVSSTLKLQPLIFVFMCNASTLERHQDSKMHMFLEGIHKMFKWI